MKKTLLTLALTLLFPLTVHAYELGYDWNYNHGYTMNEHFYNNIWEVSDGYLIDYKDNEYNNYLAKISKDGKLLIWEKSYSYRDSISECVSTSENYYCIVNNYYTDKNSIYKYNRDGKVIDKLLLNGNDRNLSYGEIFLENGKIIAVDLRGVPYGQDYSYSYDIPDTVYTIIDKGNLKIEKTEDFDDVDKEWFFKLTRNSQPIMYPQVYTMTENLFEDKYFVLGDWKIYDNGSFIIAGMTIDYNNNKQTATLVKLDKDGNIKWTKTGKENEMYYKVEGTNENELYVVGTSNILEYLLNNGSLNGGYGEKAITTLGIIEEQNNEFEMITYIYEFDGNGNIKKSHNLNTDTNNDYTLVTNFKKAKDGLIGLFQRVDLSEDNYYCYRPKEVMATNESAYNDCIPIRLHTFKYNFTYEIEKENNQNGSVIAPDKSRGDKEIEVEVKPNDGYKVEKVVIKYEDGSEKIIYDNTFIMPFENVIIKPYFVEENHIISETIKSDNDIENPPTGITSSILGVGVATVVSGEGLHIVKKKKLFKNFKKIK